MSRTTRRVLSPATETTPVRVQVAQRRLCPSGAVDKVSVARNVAPVTYMTIAGADEERLIRAYQGGDSAAGEVLIHAHRGLIHQFVRIYKFTDSPQEDLEQDAKIGFLEGVRRWDPNEGAKLSTYARWWIRQELQKSWRTGGATIRLPVHQHERRMAAKKKGCADVREAVAKGLLEAGVADAETDAWTSHVGSLDVPAGGDEGGTTLAELIPSRDLSIEEAHDQRVMVEAICEAVDATLQRLPEREQRVLERRFWGVGAAEEDQPRTLDEIGKDPDFAVSRERIRQIEEDAIVKLRGMIVVVDGMPRVAEGVVNMPPVMRIDVSQILPISEWSTRIHAWLMGQAFAPTFEILRDALGISEDIQTDGHRRALHEIMTGLGWSEGQRLLHSGRQASGYVAPSGQHPQQELFATEGEAAR